jgi:N-acetylglutamate synthase-like GNAT family acetyltransferase
MGVILDKIEYEFRPALQSEAIQIKNLINLVGINPSGLAWRRFIVAVTVQGQVVACGQIKPHGMDVIELASIAVHPDYRHQGLARIVIEMLLSENRRPVYLMCMAHNGPMYERFGFLSIHENKIPGYFARIKKLYKIAGMFKEYGEELLVMMLE